MINRRLLLLSFALVLFTITGCSPARRCQIEDYRWNTDFSLAFHDPIKSCSFSIEQGFDTLLPPNEGSLGHQLVICKLLVEDLPPGKYYLYSPNSGNIFYPECLYFLKLKDDGTFCFADKSQNGVFHLKIPAIPGFCSDWYLISEVSHNSDLVDLHSSFAYKPCVVKNEAGKTLTILKKDLGGNVLHIILNGFIPQENIEIVVDREGDIKTETHKANQDGTLELFFYPPERETQNKMKGSIRVTVKTDAETIEATSQYDTSTLELRRKQPRSYIRRKVNTQHAK